MMVMLMLVLTMMMFSRWLTPLKSGPRSRRNRLRNTRKSVPLKKQRKEKTTSTKHFVPQNVSETVLRAVVYHPVSPATIARTG